LIVTNVQAVADVLCFVHTVIYIHKDGELGFPVPHMDECENCGLCLKSCPFSDEYNEDEGE